MLTVVLLPAEGELAIKGSGWSLKGRHTISGTWSKNEMDVIQIKFKMSFLNDYWQDRFFNCSFDGERDALTGEWGSSAELEYLDGKMEFRRILPHHLAVYPSIKELSDNRPRALWRYAIAAVRNDIRRDHWSRSYFSQRRNDRETVISLFVRYFHFGPSLSPQDIETLYRTAQSLTPADACFYQSKANLRGARIFSHQ